MLDGGHRMFGGTVRAELIIVQYVASRLRLRFREGNTVRMGRRHVVHDGHGNGAVRLAAVHVRHGHGKIMGNLRVPFGLITMLRGVVVQRVGELQLARGRVEARHSQDAFIRGHGVSGKRSIFKHGHVVDDDAGHAVGRTDAQRAFGRCGHTGLPGLSAALKSRFVHRQRLGTGFGITRRHHDAVVHTIDGDGHLAFGNVAVGVGVGVGDLFRPRVTVRQRLHLRVVIVEHIAVGAVFVQREFAVPALLTGVRPRKVCTVRTGRRTFKRVAGDGIAVTFRHGMHEALDGGHVVGNDHGHHAGIRAAVAVRHGHGKVVGNLVRALAAVLLRGLRKMIGVVQTPGSRVKARHFQIAFIRGHDLPRKRRAVEHHEATDDDGSHAVGSIHQHMAGCRDGRSVAKSGFIHVEHAATGRRIGIAVVRIVGIVNDGNVIVEVSRLARRDSHGEVDIAVARRSSVGIGTHVAAGPTDIKASQAVKAVQEIGRHIVMKTVAVALCSRPSGTGGRHEVRLVHGREKVFTGNFRSLHGKGRHILAGIGGVEVLELESTAILKGNDKVIAVTGQRGFIGRKIKNKAGFRFTCNSLRSTRNRLGKSYVSHDNLLKSIKRRGKEEEEKTVNKESPAPATNRHRAYSGGGRK